MGFNFPSFMKIANTQLLWRKIASKLSQLENGYYLKNHHYLCKYTLGFVQSLFEGTMTGQ